MKTFKISKKRNEVISIAVLDFEKLVTSGSDLCLVIDSEKSIGLNVGGKLHFEKQAEGNDGRMLKVCEEDAEIKEITEKNGKKYIYFEYMYIKPLFIDSFNEISSTDPYKFKFYFTGNHNMLPCDLPGYKFYVRRGENIIEFSGLALCFPYELTKGSNQIPEGDGCTTQVGRYFNYETMERNSILATNSAVTAGNSFIPTTGDEVIFMTNPYFHINSNGEAILYSSCQGAMKESVTISKYTDYMGLNVVLEDDYDAKRIFQEHQVNDLFVKKIKNSIIPDFVDLEKIKYTPAYSGDTISLATGLTFNLHFRSRVMSNKVGEEYIFEDTWHLNDGTETWNGNGIDDTGKTREELYDDDVFVNSSNLIGYLGFTDDDIYNQKNRVKQSFLRLSFYDSNNPLTQNLLYYSTIFLDSGELFGKYVKRKAWLEEMNDEYDPALNPVVWSSAATTDPVPAVTSQLIVNDEYDMTRSGEGFNLYLFRADAPFENECQDIYMKVEFNHAGYGRTIPLICWKKKEDGIPEKLTTANYIENLYTPVKVCLTDKGYVYIFDNAVTERANGIVWEDERLVFNLFEPRIEPEN